VIPSDRGRAAFRRYGGPVSLLLAATAAVVLIRPTLHGGGSEPAAARPAKPVRPARRHAPPRRLYTVRTGDTLGSIADRFQTSVEHLLELNPGVQPTALRVGQTVRLR
jgi:LysM repeat protein